ncbi:MAG TPA: hypothetical protein VFN67_06350 [Polyangiales bacterium]|nr:hypothetical protein [Polyangiales bacterium]
MQEIPEGPQAGTTAVPGSTASDVSAATGVAGVTGATATAPRSAAAGASSQPQTSATMNMMPPSNPAGAGAAGQPASSTQPSNMGAAGMSAAGAPAQANAGTGAMAAGPCQDSCAYANGVTWMCKKRFMYGVNYAWHNFAADFGGNQAWSQPGLSAEPAVEAELESMAANGINVIRWWLWPDFRGDGVTFDAADTPMGLGGTALTDVARALELADTHDMYLMLTLFSFDNFRPTRMEQNLKIRGISPIATDDAKRRALIENVVAPLARAVEASPFKHRMIAWDIINEPEWAVKGASMYGGDPEFDPMPDLESLTHAQMEMFLRDIGKSLRDNSKAQISVGATAFKWAHAWSKLDLDFHQFHMYDWVNMYWPYDKSPKEYGLDDKPVVMGEFPLKGLTGVSYEKLLESWFGNGYAGALGWAFTDAMFNSGDYAPVKAFADAHKCETRF